MVTQTTVGNLGDVEVTITIDGDEELANFVYADLVGRFDVLKRSVESDTLPEEVERMMSARWKDYLEDND